MKNTTRNIVIGVVLAGFLAATPAAFADPTPDPAAGSNSSNSSTRHATPAHGDKRACRATPADAALCQSHVVTSADSASPLATASYAYGYRPIDLQRAYSIPAGTGAPTVAIVDAYNNPNVESDLGAYRSQFGLGPCTTANGCFSKVNQTGGTTYPAADAGWAGEIALDVEMVAAACPNCKILLVEANSANFSDLLVAVDYAAAHAQFVSNSYGAPEFNGEQNYESHFNHPGVAITVSSGDSGYGVQYPAASAYVTAVGGTNLKIDSSGNRSTETAWSGAGSGCSAYITKPAWQKDTGCGRRTVADVSAVADPNSGVAVYTSYGSTGGNNWFVYGGTSVAAPIVAALYAVAGTPTTGTTPSSYPYAATSGLFDVTSGANSSGCTTYLCSAVIGYDGPTGLGAPTGTAAFAAGTSAPPPPPPPPPPSNLAPVIDSQSKSCTGATCTFTVNAHDPEGVALTYTWTSSSSTTNRATITFSSTGSRTITATVKDAVSTVQANFAVSCRRTNRKLVCS